MEKKRFTQMCKPDTYRVDANSIGKLSGLWQMMQEAACGQMEEQKPSYTDLTNVGKALMLARVDLSIPEEIYLNDELLASSWPCPSSRATFLRNYTLEKDGQQVAVAATQWSLVDLQSRRILKVEDVDFSNYWMGEYTELLAGKFKIDKGMAEAMCIVGDKTVQYSDLDYNGHMNNTYYLDLLCDHIPELAMGTHRVSFLRIHYSREAALGEKLQVYRSEAIPFTCEDVQRYAVPAQIKYLLKTLKQDGELNVEAEITVTPIKKLNKEKTYNANA